MRALPVLAALLAFGASAQPAELCATLDLRAAVAAGWLDAGTETVGLRGSAAPLAWQATRPAADPDGDGVYTLRLTFEVAADSLVLAYKIKVDGPDNPNDGWQIGADHTAVLRPGETTDVALAWDDRPPTVPALLTGRIDTLAVESPEGLAPRDVFVYLPPGYAGGDRRYPVLYLHDGQAVFAADESGAEWGVDETAQALIEAGEVEPLVVVAVANTPARTDEYTPTSRTWRREAVRLGPSPARGGLGALAGTFDVGGDTLRVDVRDGGLAVLPPDVPAWQPLAPNADGTFDLALAGLTIAFPREADGSVARLVITKPPSGGLADRYGAFLTETVKPLVDARYRTRPDAASTGLGGSSLGGLVTVHLGLTRPDVFGRLLVASPSVWWDDRVILDAVRAARPRPEQRVWIDIGLDEGGSMVPDARALRDALVEAGWDAARVRYVEAPGAGHETRAWAARAPDMLRFLFPAE